MIGSFQAMSAEPCRDCGYRQAGWQKLSAIPGAGLPGQIQPAPLPTEMDLSSQMPPAGYQGDQASCISWAAVYAVKSYYENRSRGWGYDSPVTGGPGHHVFSPAFSQALLGNADRGSTFPEALDVLLRNGAVPWSAMPYFPDKPGGKSSPKQERIAREFRIQGYRLLSSHEPEGIKRQVASGHPVMVGILLYESLLDLKQGVYEAAEGPFLGGHSVVIVGYDDDRGKNGAFKIMNSWGQDWGENGFGWISYDAMSYMIRTALIIEDGSPAQNEIDPPKHLPSPEDVVASTGSSSRYVALVWKTVDSALAYEIQRAPLQKDGDLDFYTIGYSTSTRFQDSTVDPGRSYAYRVLSLDEKGRTETSRAPVVTGYASREASPDARVEIISGKVLRKGTQIYALITWNEGRYSAELQRWNEARGRWDALGVSSGGEFKDYRISPGGRYTYRMRPVSGGIKGLWSRPLVLSAAGANLPPSIVTGLQVSRGSLRGSIKLSWDSAPGVDEYLVYRFDPASQRWEGPFRTRQASFQDSSGSLEPGEWYGYRIVPVNAAGSGPSTPVVYGRTSPALTAERTLKKLDAPEELQVHRQSPGSFSLEWKSVGDADSYDIVSVSLPGTDYATLGTVEARPGNRQSYSLKISEPGIQAFRIVARSGPTVSPASEPAVAFENPPVKTDRWFGLEEDAVAHRSYRAVDWNDGGDLIEYSLTLDRKGNESLFKLKGGGKEKAIRAAAPGDARIFQSSGWTLIRSGDGRYIQVIDRGDAGLFTNGSLLFV
ncbi:MAG: hypothetical protein KDK25_08645, partial [Leptospiraceae bacterium]|nr:hypothetical protein [Leptospiraceae bacterium]